MKEQAALGNNANVYCAVSRSFQVLFALLLTAIPGALAAQTQTLEFEVASIKAVPPSAELVERGPGFTAILPGGQYVDPRTNLMFMVAIAYGVKNPDRELVGLPGWATSQMFAVAAKPAPGFPLLSRSENRERVRAMLRRLLEMRFHLRLHSEVHQDRVYNVGLAKSGIRIRAVPAPQDPSSAGRVDASLGRYDVRVIGHKSTVAGLCDALSVFVSRPLIDRTGIKGYFDFDVRWDESMTEHALAGPATEDDRVAMIGSMLNDRFGLNLTYGTGPVQYWVIDHVERPSVN